MLGAAATVEMVRAELESVTAEGAVGEHAASYQVEERLVALLFECLMPGYRGWRWMVSVARPPRGRKATVCEIELLPGEDALLAPQWVPWAERLAPGDLTRADRLPFKETDERLEPGWEAARENEGDAAAIDDPHLGRPRVLSPEGVTRAAQRWYDGAHGPEAEGVRRAHATCSNCGFMMNMSGPLRGLFGICANEWAEDDGKVVSLDHGCGAHSETDIPDQGPEWPITPAHVDDQDVEPVKIESAAPEAANETAENTVQD